VARGWVAPSDFQRELLRVLLLAEFPARDAMRAALDGAEAAEDRDTTRH
jgi:hypothetical protein